MSLKENLVDAETAFGSLQCLPPIIEAKAEEDEEEEEEGRGSERRSYLVQWRIILTIEGN